MPTRPFPCTPSSFPTVLKPSFKRRSCLGSSKKPIIEPRYLQTFAMKFGAEMQADVRNAGAVNGLEFDHVIPVSKGGSSAVRNLELLCEVCNRAKGPAARLTQRGDEKSVCLTLPGSCGVSRGFIRQPAIRGLLFPNLHPSQHQLNRLAILWLHSAQIID